MQWFAGPVAAGTVLTVAVAAGHPVTGPVRWLTTGLSLIPAVLVHCHQRYRDFTWPQTIAVSLAAATVAYAIIILGMAAGAAATFTVYIAADTGALATAAQLSGILGLALTVASRRRAT